MNYHDQDVFGVYKLTEEEKIRIGLKKPEPEEGTICVAIPVHYRSGMQWENRLVTPAQLKRYRAQYPGLRVIRRK